MAEQTRADWGDVNKLTRRVWIVREGVWTMRVPLEPREYAALVDARDGALRELRRVEAVRAKSERVALKALKLAEEVYGWAVHEPNHHRLLGRLAELREELTS